MKTIIGLCFGFSLIVAAWADDIKPESISSIASTVWSYADDQGRHREFRFEADGSAWVRYITASYKRSKGDELAPNFTGYEIRDERRGTWTQNGTSVQFIISDTEMTIYPALKKPIRSADEAIAEMNKTLATEGTHPTLTYDGTIQGARMSGTVSSASGNGRPWSAEKVRDPKDIVNGSPKVLLSVAPRYPVIEKLFSDQLQSGSATVRAEISPAGDVLDVKVIRATRKGFGDSAVEAVSSWKFSPKVTNGEAVPCAATLTVEFKPHSS